MKANDKYLNKSLDFWSNIKLLNQKLGYVYKKSKSNPNPRSVIPTIVQVKKAFKSEKLEYSSLIINDKWTDLGTEIIEYLEYRDEMLQTIKSNLMKQNEAKSIFEKLFQELAPTCPLPMNKQKGNKKGYAFLTCIVNMLIESTLKKSGFTICDYDPRALTSYTNGKKPVRTLSRRVDGAYPSIINPKAIWEIKEYYYTTTFGSRVADGVYETQLDGWELREVKESLGIYTAHYLITDDYFTWWEKGKSYLCRIIDSMHMGLLTEALFGKEVIERIPELVNIWIKDSDKEKQPLDLFNSCN